MLTYYPVDANFNQWGGEQRIYLLIFWFCCAVLVIEELKEKMEKDSIPQWQMIIDHVVIKSSSERHLKQI